MIVIILVCVDLFKRRILNKDKEKYRNYHRSSKHHICAQKTNFTVWIVWNIFFLNYIIAFGCEDSFSFVELF